MATEGRLEALFPWGSRRRSLVRAPLRAARAFRDDPARALALAARPWVWVPRMVERANPPPEGMAPVQRYELWSSIHHLDPRLLRRKRRLAARRSADPLVSILLPVFDPDPKLLDRALDSVMKQVSRRWELCIADDGSRRRDHIDRLERLSDPRIKVRLLPDNRGISDATNAALELATGELCAMLDQDDELAPDAVYEIARYSASHPHADFFYSDEEKIDDDGRVIDYYFKPRWSPDLELATNYANHVSVVRTEVLRNLGGFRKAYDGAQDYDLVLRATEVAREVGHIPLPLYSWRSTSGSVAEAEAAKPWAYDAGRRALQDALDRRGVAARVEDGSFPGAHEVRYEHASRPPVVVVLHGGSTPPSALGGAELRIAEGSGGTGTAGWARALNRSVADLGGDAVILFLRSGLEPVSGEWLDRLLEHVLRPEVGAVGAPILAEDGRPLREEVIVGAAEQAAGEHAAYRAAPELVRNVAALTGDILALDAATYRAAGRFDEGLELGADADLCLRVLSKGLRVLLIPSAAVSGEPGPWRPPHADRAFRRRWGSRDPYYNPNLSNEARYLLGV